MPRRNPGVGSLGDLSRADALALAYLALPSAIFIGGWILSPLGPVVAALVTLAVLSLTKPWSAPARSIGLWLVPVGIVAALWCVMAGVGHFVYANLDWKVRDSVLVDLVVRPWPVVYVVDDVVALMRAPIGFFLPAALVGKLWGTRAAELALFAWTFVGVALVFALMLRDRPTAKSALIRIGVFVVFSGMDIVGQVTHYKPYGLGEHLEWWAFLFQYSSHTTQLFWVPNHALPGWIAIAWLLGQDPRRLSVPVAVSFVVFAPLWSPLTAIGIAPIFAAALSRRLVADRSQTLAGDWLDWRMLVPVVACCALVFPYLVAGSDKLASGTNDNVRWVGEDFVPRYVEFVLFEFAGFALLLWRRNRRDPLLWSAIVVLLALPFYRFGPYNDLAMRASIPALALLAIRTGEWLSTPFARKDGAARLVAIALLGVGAVTPFMEFARVFIEPRWDVDIRRSLPDVTRGTHYFTPADQSWVKRFMRLPEVSGR